MGYIVTNQDRMSMIKIISQSWHVNFISTNERGDTYTRWDIQAINPIDKIYYRSDGASIAEAIENWFLETKIPEVPCNTSLYEAKATEITGGDAEV